MKFADDRIFRRFPIIPTHKFYPCGQQVLFLLSRGKMESMIVFICILFILVTPFTAVNGTFVYHDGITTFVGIIPPTLEDH